MTFSCLLPADLNFNPINSSVSHTPVDCPPPNLFPKKKVSYSLDEMLMLKKKHEELQQSKQETDDKIKTLLENINIALNNIDKNIPRYEEWPQPQLIIKSYAINSQQFRVVFTNYSELLFLRFKTGNVEVADLKKILNTTYFESENNNKEMDTVSADLIFSYFLVFLQRRKNQPFSKKLEEQLSNNPAISDEFFKLFFLCAGHITNLRHFNCIQDEALHRRYFRYYVNYVLYILQNLNDNQRYLLPGGWGNCNLGGHFMLYLIERVDRSTFKRIRINTHDADFLKSHKNHSKTTIETELLRTADLQMFVNDIFTLQSSFGLNDVIKDMNKNEFSPTDMINHLMIYGHKIADDPAIVRTRRLVSCKDREFDFERQKFSANCVFMSFLASFQYLKGAEIGDPILAKKITLKLRNKFQKHMKFAVLYRKVQENPNKYILKASASPASIELIENKSDVTESTTEKKIISE
jgi:hypothetical protein